MNTFFFCILLTLLFASVTAGGLNTMLKVLANSDQVVTDTAFDSDTTGKLKFFFDRFFTKMRYDVIITNPVGITGVHLHCGSAGTNGGIVASLTGFAWLESEDVQDTECEGVQLNNIASLYQAIRQGSIYFNIHSTDYPQGVARGQIFIDDYVTPPKTIEEVA